MSLCKRCAAKEKEREKLVKALTSEIVLSRFLAKLFNTIGNNCISLTDYNRFISYFRLSKADGKEILKRMEKEGIVAVKGKRKKNMQISKNRGAEV